MSYLLGSLVLDWTGDELFPFLYGEDMGCGGLPPWGNLETARLSAYHFRRGKVKESVIGIMEEAISVFMGVMPHEEMIFMTAARAAMVDKGSAKKALEPVLAMREEGLNRIGISDLVSALRGDPLEQKFVDIAFEVDARDSITGSILASARRRGLIMTELDLRLLLATHERNKLLLGNTPVKEVLAEYEGIEQNLRKKGLNLIRGIMTNFEYFDKRAQERLKPNVGWEILPQYYRTRKGYFAIDSSLSYGGMMRIFRKEDVRTLMNQYENIGNAIIRPYQKALEQSYFPVFDDEKVNYNQLKTWLSSVRMGEPFTNIPEGFTTGDTIILNEIVNGGPGILYLAVTDDKDLIKRGKI
jgi:hypothetical protein